MACAFGCAGSVGIEGFTRGLAVELVMRGMMECEDLPYQAKANNKHDFFAGPTWHAPHEITIKASERHRTRFRELAVS